MKTIKHSTDTSTTNADRTGVYLGILQLVFTLGWTTYLVYLPHLAAEVGMAPSAVLFILMLDQAIFAVSDTAMGITADRIAPFVGRLGPFVGCVTALSCAAFVALPFVAGNGPGAQGWFITLIVIWTMTSSALRAPPLTLLKHRDRPSIPFLAALALVGYGLAGAVSPYLGAALRDHDARLPFVISSAVLLVTTLALSPIERKFAQKSPTHEKPCGSAKPLGGASITFVAPMVLLAVGFQLHLSVNSAPLFLRFVKPGDVEWWLSVFWIGFNLAMFPASVVVGHRGGLIVMGIAGLLGASALLGADYAGNLNTLIAAHFVAGAAWGCMMMSAISASLEIGRGGAEGKVLGLMFSALAVATFTRIAVVAGGLPKRPEYASLLHYAPALCWLIAGAALLALAAIRVRQGALKTPTVYNFDVPGRE
jgi:MFS family permease